MHTPTNPFHELYVTETISSEAFVDVFSDTLVNHTLALFQPGNVVLRGIGGSGKSMMLNLLRPQIRLAYLHAAKPFPVPEGFSRFVGAGINLTRSGAIAFGQRPVSTSEESDAQQLPLYFGDFVNYHIVRDLFLSLRTLTGGFTGGAADEVGIAAERESFDSFAEKLSRDPVWSGYCEGCSTFDALFNRLSHRLRCYRDFFNFNSDAFPKDLRETKTSIGEPVSAAVEALWSCGVLARDTRIYIRIDQYEQLMEIREPGRPLHAGSVYAHVVNRLLGARDPRVSYRVGVRHYAWRSTDLAMFGSTSVLEKERNYKEIDLDYLLRRSEWPNSLFPRFAEDVFRKRLIHVGYDPAPRGALNECLGKDISPQDKVERYARQPRFDVAFEAPVPDAFRQLIESLAVADPLSAKLGEAWARQQIARGTPIEYSGGDPPWAAKSKEYWRKERVQLALMQIAAGRAQRMFWAGAKDVLSLSGGNILVFVSLCQQVFDAWIRSLEPDRPPDEGRSVHIDPLVQNEGISIASQDWHSKITELPGGHARQRFVDVVGRKLRETLLADKTMSNPGGNGFSLRTDDLDPVIRGFLDECVDYGALYDRPHTTKNKDRYPRRKWFITPVLSPHYQLPVQRTKEPLYVASETVRDWLVEARVLAAPIAPASRANEKDHPDQLSLF